MNIDELLENLERLRRALCDYPGMKRGNCDCKFGLDGLQVEERSGYLFIDSTLGSGEAKGCAELQQAIEFIENIRKATTSP